MRLLEQVLSYFCTILLKLDNSVKGPYITQESIAGVMIGINVPLGAYFVYDISADVREHFAPLRQAESSPWRTRGRAGSGCTRTW